MRRQERGFPEAVSSIVSSHHPPSRVRVSLTLTDNWRCRIVFPLLQCSLHITTAIWWGRRTSLTSIIADLPGANMYLAIGRDLALVRPSFSILYLRVCYILLSGKESDESVL